MRRAEKVRSVHENRSGFGILCISMDTNQATLADGRSIADEPHVATYTDLHAWTSMGYVFLLEVALCLSREKAIVENIQSRDRFDSEFPLKMSVVRESPSTAF